MQNIFFTYLFLNNNAYKNGPRLLVFYFHSVIQVGDEGGAASWNVLALANDIRVNSLRDVSHSFGTIYRRIKLVFKVQLGENEVLSLGGCFFY